MEWLKTRLKEKTTWAAAGAAIAGLLVQKGVITDGSMLQDTITQFLYYGAMLLFAFLPEKTAK